VDFIEQLHYHQLLTTMFVLYA